MHYPLAVETKLSFSQFDYGCLRAVRITQELLHHASRKLQTHDLQALFGLVANMGIICDNFILR